MMIKELKNETMKTFKARFKANDIENLKTFLVFGIKYNSTKSITGNSLFVSWICEDENTTHEDIMDLIDMMQAEAFNVELVAFFKS